MEAPRTSGRPLSDEAVGKAALSVLARDGITGLSFRRVGTQLGTSHMAVHRHCVNFDGLLNICTEYLAARLPKIDPALRWSTSIELLYTALYETMSAHWELLALLRGRPWTGPKMTSRFSEPALRAGLAAGLTPSQVMSCHRELYVYTVGCALTQGVIVPNAAAIAAMESLAADKFPIIVEHREALLTAPHSDREMFTHGLRTLIASWDPAECSPRRLPSARESRQVVGPPAKREPRLRHE
jgi:AcrR family transcriptional regulator